MKSIIVNVVFTLLAVLVFNAVAFLPPLGHTDTFWACYACCWIVSVLSFAVVAIATIGDKNSARYLYGFPFFYISALYLVAGIVFNLICLVIAAVPAWAVVLVNIVLAALLVAAFFGSGVGRDYIEEQDRAKASQMSFVTALRNQTQQLASAAASTGVAEDARALVDAARYSDPMSVSALANEENAVMGYVFQAKAELGAGNEAGARIAIQQAMLQLEQRNRLLKSYK